MPGTGQLFWTGKSWSARYWTILEGERVRQCVSLGTDNRAVATAKLARLVTGGGDAAKAARPETFEQAARRIVAQQAKEGLASWKDRLARLERFAFPSSSAMSWKCGRPTFLRR